MKKRLSSKESVFIAIMLFGMFFGAGNMIFPVHLGQMAGYNVWPAVIGFIIVGVGIPILGVASIGITKSSGLLELSSKVSKPYGIFFTCLLYLTIGPFFAIPRCATVPFSIGVEPLISSKLSTVSLVIFTLIFFALVLYFSLRPGEILTWVGKVLTPLFLLLLSIMLVVAFIKPMSSDISSITPDPSYMHGAFGLGFLEGYNTMDAIAGLAFGIIVVNEIKRLGVNEPTDIAKNTLKSGIISALIMAFIYILITLMGTLSRGKFEISENGSIALAEISGHYFGTAGTILLAAITTVACLKTSIGLVTSFSQTFSEMFPKGPSYKLWTLITTMVSFLIANVGLSSIINYSIPILMLLYPLAISLIILGLFSKLFKDSRIVYVSVTIFVFIAAIFDFIKAISKVFNLEFLAPIISFASKVFPFFDSGFGWLIPSIIGFIIGLIFMNKKKGTI